ncbi:hypothetical protein Y032_0030g2105 [Ancylostoma ceylanicum]|uniref:Uncharacterized protein n=1 Tax=Ancylostoma ceylanicum TaxID=53326 RepID=A0A016URI5_9BILA|nr:hypothetical protein Y032_0030g2105 [Ancylostoma ceylanicum]
MAISSKLPLRNLNILGGPESLPSLTFVHWLIFQDCSGTLSKTLIYRLVNSLSIPNLSCHSVAIMTVKIVVDHQHVLLFFL